MQLNESFHFNDLSHSDREKIYNIFKQSYEKATGSAWSQSKFNNRASQWLFFGTTDGFVTVRPQQSGFYKLTGVAGDRKGIMQGLQELTSQNFPVWGMLTPELGNILIKRYGFKKPSKIQAFLLSKLIPSNVFGNIDYVRNKDGTITFKYPDVGETTKVFVGNNQYYDKLKKEIKNKISIKNILKEDDLNELRAVPYYEDSFERLKKYLEEHGYENSYVSFRSKITTNWVNRDNQWNTPTGYYSYPLWTYPEVPNAKNIEDFKNSFPWIPDGTKYIVLFQIDNYDTILKSEDTDENKIKHYINRIREIWKDNIKIQKICDDYENDELTAIFPDGKTSTFKSEFQKFWLFIYTVAGILNWRLNHGFTRICQNIGLDGFLDDGCTGTIHKGEKCQAVFFIPARKFVKEEIVIDLTEERYDAPLNIDDKKRDAQNIDHFEKKRAFEKYLTKKLDVNNVILNVDYRRFAKKNLPFFAKLDTDKGTLRVFINKRGERTISGLSVEMLGTQGQRAAYFNTKYKTDKFVSIGPFDFLGNENLAKAEIVDEKNIGKTVIIDKSGDITFNGVPEKKLIETDGPLGNLTRSYFSMKFNKAVKVVFTIKDKFMIGTEDGNYEIVNGEGNGDIIGLTIRDVMVGLNYYSARTRANIGLATYFNQKFGTDYAEIMFFHEIGYNRGVAKTKKGKLIFVNERGIPTTEDIKTEGLTPETLAALINQKYGKDYLKVGNFDSNKYAVALYRDGNEIKEIIIDKIGELYNDLDFNSLKDSHERAILMNQKHGTNYKSLDEFDILAPNIAIATIEKSTHIKISFINRDGELSTKNVNLNTIDGFSQKYVPKTMFRAAFINQKYGTDWFKINSFDGGELAFAFDSNNRRHLINRKGETNINKVNLENVRDSFVRAEYINKKYNKSFKKVDPFGEFGKNVALAYGERYNRYFISPSGNLSIATVDLEKVNEVGDVITMGAYFRQKYKLPYTTVYKFGKLQDPDIAMAFMSGTNPVPDAFINKRGELDTGYLKLENFTSPAVRAVFLNQKYGTDYDKVSTINKDILNKGVVWDADRPQFFINETGSPDTEGIDLKDINNDQNKAVFLRQKYGKEFHSVSDMVIGNKTIHIGTLMTTQTTKIINSKGEISVDEIDPESISRDLMFPMHIIQLYLNQKFGENYVVRAVMSAGLYCVTKENLSLKIVDIHNEETVRKLKIEDLNEWDSIHRTAFINTKFGTNFRGVSKFINGKNRIFCSDEKKSVYINKEGKPDVSTLEISDVNAETSMLTTFINQKYNKNYREVNGFFQDKKFGIGVEDNGRRILINREGNPLTPKEVSEYVAYKKIDSITEKKAYYNTKFNKNFDGVFDKSDYPELKCAVLGKEYGKGATMLNDEGEESLCGYEPKFILSSDDHIITSPIKAAIINILYNKDYIGVSEFQNYDGKLIAKAKYGSDVGGFGGKEVFINIKGEPTLKGIPDEVLKKNSVITQTTKDKIESLKNDLNEIIKEEISTILGKKI